MGVRVSPVPRRAPVATVWSAVEQLEGGAGDEESGGAVDYGFVGSVKASDVAGEGEQDDAHGGHEGGTEDDGGVACVARVDGRTAAEGLADADGGGGREAERNHVGEGDGVESDLVAGLGDGAETGDEGSDESEYADFSGELECGGKAERD